MDFSSSDEVFKYFESFTNLERTMSFTEREYRLDRMQYLLDLFDNPQKCYKIIHIAGSKGKGSTASAAASILSFLGYKTGLYTSPHLISYKERITHAGSFIDDRPLLSEGRRIKTVLENEKIPFPDPPTTFELLTLFAFLVFRETGCEWAVIETGIGGRLDATNTVIPEASVICPVEIEHSEILGDTVEKIAFEKSGIIKEGKPVFVSRQKKEALEIIRKQAEEKSAPIFVLDDYIEIKDISLSRSGTFFNLISGGKTTAGEINLIGGFQAYNAALSMLAVGNLLGINYSDIVPALKNILLSGRIEIIYGENRPDIIIDSSHTPDSALMLSKTLKKLYRGKGILIFGAVDGKDYKKMMNNLADCFDDIIISKPGTFKKSSPEKIYSDLHMVFPEKNIILETAAVRALKTAGKYSGGEKHIVVTGSFYMASEIKKLLSGDDCFGKSF